MKTLALCLLVLSATSCQRYVVVSTSDGKDVHVQGNRVSVVDADNNFRSYYVKGAYKQYCEQKNVEELLTEMTATPTEGELKASSEAATN